MIETTLIMNELPCSAMVWQARSPRGQPASDSRVASAVCDGGFWEDWEIQYFASRPQFCLLGRARPPRYQMSSRIKCPYLIAVGEHDYADVKDWENLYRYSKRRGAKIDLKIFSNEENGIIASTDG